MNKLSALAVLAATLVALGSSNPAPTRQSDGPSFGLFFYESPEGFASRTGAKSKAYWENWTGYIGSIQQSGAMESGSGLRPPTISATFDKKGQGSLDAKKVQLSGYVIVKAKSIEEAKAIAQKSPAIAEGGRVEVREILPMSEHTGGN